MKTPVNISGKTVLVTGSPGFIGSNLVIRLINEMKTGTVISLDNMNGYYDVRLKEYRLEKVGVFTYSKEARRRISNMDRR